MNQENYGTLEPCKKLADAGIVLTTDFVWYVNGAGWKLSTRDWVENVVSVKYEVIPAPTLAEVWIELPQDILHNAMVCSLMMWKFNKGVYTEVGYWWHDQIIKSIIMENSTDAAINLLIWLKENER